MKDGDLNIYDDVVGQNFFQVSLKRSSLVLRAGSYVGLIPLNESVFIEVQPRIPVTNLEHVLLFSESYSPAVLRLRERGYATTSTQTPSLLDMLVLRFLSLLDLVHYEGLHFVYSERVLTNHAPCGRIAPYASAYAQAKKSDPFIAVSKRFERSFDNPPNRCLRTALHHVRQAYASMQRKGGRQITSQIAQAERLLQAVPIDDSMSFLSDPSIEDHSLLPIQRPSYSAAIALATTILFGRGLDIRRSHGSVLSPSVLINMEQVFERYVREVLRKTLDAPVVVLDGNKFGDQGAAQSLFSDATPVTAKSISTPDVVIRNPSDGGLVVLDAKYKDTTGLPDRDDLNQVLTYGLTYECLHVGLVYPHRQSVEPHVQFLGRVGPIRVYRLAFDLGTSDLALEENRFGIAVRDLLIKSAISNYSG